MGSNGFRYSVYETSSSKPRVLMPGHDNRILAAIKKLLSFGRRRRTGIQQLGLSSPSRMDLALAIAQQYVLVSQHSPLDECLHSDQAMTMVANTPTLQNSPVSGITLREDIAQCSAAAASRSKSLDSHRTRNRPLLLAELRLLQSAPTNTSMSPTMVASRENPLFC
ncbi:hypothetical protein H4R26_000364 [Coemansia thaxteri]|uniref:Uncharacterized protein n=1 Tax=Coemansia thaxteri TaxID=2663907 RepID=A0A9W8BNY2_9FUNG|nr:hypothetical protein H4R26_000364 [Coemansia thaxteri]